MVGGLEEGVAGRQTESKALVVIAAQADGPGIGRIRMRVIEDASAASLPLVCEGLHRSRQHASHRRLAGIRGLRDQRLPAGDHAIAGPPEGSIRVDAARAQDCLAVEAVDIGYAPRRSGTAPSAVLPGRIHVSLQSPEVEKPRQALLPANAASREHASGNLRRDGQTAQTSYTTCWGKLSERDTH